ncbi:MAG TPA: hypothetical protein VKH41_11765 [Myxococcota bacterium]|nr:hypothetical protein [Myxococcota bacterium]
MAVSLDGHRAEAALAVSAILSPEEADSFAAMLEHRPDVMRKAASAHVRAGSLVGWTGAAREFKAALDAVGDLNDFIGESADGSLVFEDDGGRLWFRPANGGRVVDLRAAIGAGIARLA